jgi:hypothetical protein
MQSFPAVGLSAWRARAAVALLAAAAACGGSSQGTAPGGDGGTTPPPDGYPAPHPPMPLVTNQMMGAAIASPQLVTVTFQGDTLATPLHAFSDAIPGSAWWTQVSGDYGAGTMTNLMHVTDVQGAAGSYTDVDAIGAGPSSMATFIQQEVADGIFPDPGASTVYLIYLPMGTTVTLDASTAQPKQSCVNGGFAGYHSSTKITPKAGGAAVDAAYAIVARCDPPIPQLMMTQQTFMTLTASHEVIEAVTDSKPVSVGPQWVMPDGAWGAVAGGEVADLCSDVLGTGQDQWSEGSFVYQRSWSNTSAKAGHDPCVPIPMGEVYFNAAPQTELVQLGIGGSSQVELDAFSDAEMAAWKIEAIDVGAALSMATSQLTITLDKTSVKNGDVAHATIKLGAAIPDYGFGAGLDVVYIVSLVDSSNAHFWPIVVEQH